MTFDPDWKWGHVTRDGRSARIVEKNFKTVMGNKLLAVINDPAGDVACAFGMDGRFAHLDRPFDLFNAPAPKRKFEFWVNVYEDCAAIYTDKQKAERCYTPNRVAFKHIIVEEGEGLE